MVGTLALGVVGLALHVVPATLGRTGLRDRAAVPAPIVSVSEPPASLTATPAAEARTADRDTDPPADPGPPTGGTKPAQIISVPSTGPGTYVHAKQEIAPASNTGTLIRYDVRVEKDVDIDADQAAKLIARVLNDERSWRGTGRWRFELVSSADQATLHAYISTPGTTDQLCAPLLTRGEVSCQNGDRVVLNAKRWVLGADAYGTDVDNYRRYLVNHEFGHSLGYQHVSCPGAGKSAPVMMQQTKGLGGCRKNPWPLGSRD